MAIPFKPNPEPPKRQAEDDPFLEFDSERPGVRPKMPSHEPLFRPELPEVRSERMDFNISEPTLGLGQPQQRPSAISPMTSMSEISRQSFGRSLNECPPSVLFF